MSRSRSAGLCAAAFALAVLASSCASDAAAGRAAGLEADLVAQVAAHPGRTIGIAFRDLRTGSTVEIGAAEPFHAASTMKVPVMLEAYRQAAAGRLDLDAPVLVQNSFASIVDGSAYALDPAEDSDPALYGELGRTATLRALIARMIGRSSNLATNIVIARVGAAAVQRTVESLGARDLKVLRGVEDQKAYDRSLNNVTTAHDLMLVMEAVARGRLVPRESAREMLEVLRAQEFNEMIPAGLPAEVRPHVAHKTGQITAVHHDAAIVRPPGRDGFVLVILTRGFESHAESAAAGAAIAATVWRHYAEGAAR